MAKNWLKQYAQNGKNISFEEYYKQVPKSKNDTSGYDLRTFYANNPEEAWKFANSAEGHAPDTYKKPNHITFSNESMYATPDNPGGKWGFENNQDVFYATPQNVKNAGGVNKLKKYFQDQEKNVKLVLPKKQNGGTIGNWWDELTKAKYGQNMPNMTDEQIAMVRDVNRVTDDPLMIPASPRVKAQSGTKISSKGYKKNSPDKNEPMLTIPSNRITMQDVEHPVMAYPSAGKGIMMHPGGEYYFPHADYVTEVPVAQNGWSSSDLAKLREANANYKPSPYQDMDPAMLQQYRENQRVMQLAATPQGKVQLKKEAEDKKYANKKKQEVAKDKETRKELQEQYARDRFNANPSVINPEYWQTDPQTGRTPQQRLDDMGTDLQTRVFRVGTDVIDNLNPGVWVAGMAGNLAKAPLRAQQQNSYTPYLSALGEPLAWGIGEELMAPYVKNIFGKKPVLYGESNVAPHDPYSSVADNWQSVTRGPVIAHEPFSEPYPNHPGSITPATGNKAATLVEVPALNKQQEILQSFGLDPNNPGKVPEDIVSLYRVQGVGTHPDKNMLWHLQEKAKNQKLGLSNQLNLEMLSDPEKYELSAGEKDFIARDKYHGKWFDKNPKNLDFYLDPETTNAPDNTPLEILKYDLPKSEAMKYNVANFEDAKSLSRLHDQEFVLPKDFVEKAQRYPASDWQKLIDQHKAWGLLPAGFTLGALKSAMSQGDNKKYGGKLTKNWLQNY